jgi:hypothetical protein
VLAGDAVDAPGHRCKSLCAGNSAAKCLEKQQIYGAAG